jgi:hypothetical protein
MAPDITALHVVEADKARQAARLSVNSHGKRQTSVNITNNVMDYIAAVTVGSSGSFNLIVSADYGSGSFSGKVYTDTVTLGVSVKGLSIGVADKSAGFSDLDGIIGFGPEDLTNTVLGTPEVPTFMQSATSQGLIPANILGVSFKAITLASGQTNGILTLGGTSSSSYTGSITYGSLTSTPAASKYWGIDVTFYGDGKALGSASGVVDTSTTLIYLPSDVTTSYFSGTGFTLDSRIGLYSASSSSGAKDLGIEFAGTNFTISAADTLVPTLLYSVLGLTSGTYYSWINDAGTAGTGLDFVIGQKALEHLYTVFDTANNKLGFATSSG